MRPTIEQFSQKPVSVGLVRCEPDPSGLVDSELANELSVSLAIPFFKTGYTVFRGVELSRLPVVLRTGIDVEPSDSVFYSAEFDKALEYGGWPKIVLALDGECLTKTFKEIPADTSEEEIALVRKTYSTVLKSEDGTRLWLSRLKETDPRIGGPYEAGYAWWIEGDALRALKGIMVLCASHDTDTYMRIRAMFGSS